MTPVFDAVRERLPSLYRPDDFEGGGDIVPLVPGDLLELNGAPPPEGSVVAASGTLRVSLPTAAHIAEVALAPRVTGSSLLTLELYRLSGHAALPVPGAVARVSRGRASPLPRFEERRFAIRLRRPELLTALMWAGCSVLEQTQVEAGEVMQAHWFDFADRALHSRFVARARALQGLDRPTPGDPELMLHPYISDLSRIGSLLGLLPWREPAVHRERVEDYRLRIARMVRLYREGLGTVNAIRRMTEAQLPIDLAAPPGLRDRPFTVEEDARVILEAEAASTRGAPDGVVGPLMRWAMESSGRFAASATVVLEGVEPVPGTVDPTERPVLELFSAGGARARIGIGYAGTLGPGQALRLRPAYASWVGGEAGLIRGESQPTETLPADPTADGPWTPAPGGPGTAVTALLQSADRALWVATEDGGGRLHRFDGTAWTVAIDGLSAVHLLAERDGELLIGTAEGLRRMRLHPDEGDPFALEPAPAEPAPAVRAATRAADGTWYIGTDSGLTRLTGAEDLDPFGIGADAATELPVYGIHQDHTGTIHLGTERGLFRFQPALGHWYWYRGEDRSDQHPDFAPFDPGATETGFPQETDVFLPPVRCVRRGPDAALWLGTDRGIARYGAFPATGLAYTTMLQALPQLGDGRVHAIEEDERGLIWFATDHGLLRFDGRDWAQLQDGVLVRLPRQAPAGELQWRFNRGLDRWETFDLRSGAWTAWDGDAVASDEAPVMAVAWTDGVAADLGTWADGAFTPDEGAAPAQLRMRYKPTETRIVDGGIPAVPRVPPGASVWRYLALEPDSIDSPGTSPAWTCEGRLLPPPEDRDPVLEGRYGAAAPLDLSQFGDAAFAFNPAARVHMAWGGRHPLAVLVRLAAAGPEERVHPAILDRVWQGIQQVRPAGVRTMLAVDEEIVRSTEE